MKKKKKKSRMNTIQLSEEDMQSSRGQGKSWKHETIQEELQNAYDEEQGGTQYIGWKLEDIASEFYDGTLEELEELKYTNPNVNTMIRGDLREAGFDDKSKQEDKKWAVANETKTNGTVVFKVELTPL